MFLKLFFRMNVFIFNFSLYFVNFKVMCVYDLFEILMEFGILFRVI